MQPLETGVNPSRIANAEGILFIAGATATGKSELALRLAERIPAEIVSVDSMQVYRGMDIGTAKPGLLERAKVPHHLIDVVTPLDAFDASRFVALASAAAADIRARGRVPIFCGGTGLYFQAFLHGLGEAPPADLALRRELYALPMETLVEELGEKDPATLARIDRKNPRRVVRAVEVIRLTGRPYFGQRSSWSASEVTGWCVVREPDELRRRIDQRVELMFSRGLVEETQCLISAGLEQNPIAMQALGYRQVVEHLRGERDLVRTVEQVKVRTRRFAKRQGTWFRGQMNLPPLRLMPGSDLAHVAETLVGELRKTGFIGREGSGVLC